MEVVPSFFYMPAFILHCAENLPQSRQQNFPIPQTNSNFTLKFYNFSLKLYNFNLKFYNFNLKL